MWSSYLSLIKYQRKPSDDLAPSEWGDSILAWCIDKTVLWFGITVENLLGETVEVGYGKDKRHDKKYTIEQLLDCDFKLPRLAPTPKVRPMPAQDGFALLLALAREGPRSGVKMWEYVKPN